MLIIIRIWWIRVSFITLITLLWRLINYLFLAIIIFNVNIDLARDVVDDYWFCGQWSNVQLDNNFLSITFCSVGPAPILYPLKTPTKRKVFCFHVVKKWNLGLKWFKRHHLQNIYAWSFDWLVAVFFYLQNFRVKNIITEKSFRQIFCLVMYTCAYIVS